MATITAYTAFRFSKAVIFTDSQAAIKAITNPRHQSGQYILEQILDISDLINNKYPQYEISIEWVPGHEGIEVNEKQIRRQR